MKLAYVISLLMLASCGNPHLISKKGLKGVNLPIITTPQDLKPDFNDVKIVTSQGDPELNIININIPTSDGQILVVTNQDDKEMEVSYHFETGTHFSFKGGIFPGTDGNCLPTALAPTETCKVDIVFTANDPGAYLDKLIVTFKPKDTDVPARVIEFPLYGERKNTTPIATIALKVETINGESSVKFGSALTNQLLSRKLIVTNIGQAPVTFAASFEKNKGFSFSSGKYPGSRGNCGSNLAIAESCSIEVSFIGNTVGSYTDNHVIKYKDSAFPESAGLEVKTPLSGEKKSKNDNASTPGNLIASQIMGDIVDFGSASKGSKITKQVEITNTGTRSVQINKTAFSGDNSFSFNGGSYPGTRGTCGEVILKGNCLLDLVFEPNRTGSHNGILSIKNDDVKNLELKLVGKSDESGLCYEFNEVLRSPLNQEQTTSLIFPYNSTAAGTTSKLAKIYGTGVNYTYPTTGAKTVKDAQVYVQYDLEGIKDEVIDIHFGVDVQKIVLDNFKDTESLCLSTSKIRKCSGQEFSLASWQKLKNKDFWDLNDHPVSDKYTKQFNEGNFSCGNTSCMRLKKIYDLGSIFELTSSEMQKVISSGRVNLVFSDDTRLNILPKLVVKTLKVIDCK